MDIDTRKKSFKVCIVCVCYNSYLSALGYIESIKHSFPISNEQRLELSLIFVDNSSEKDNKQIKKINDAAQGFEFIYLASKNIGYFPAIKLGLDFIGDRYKEFDYICFSNVDVRLAETFFGNLLHVSATRNIGVLAPSIITAGDNADINPKIVSRPSKLKLYLYIVIYSFGFLYSTLIFLNKLKKRRKGLNSKFKVNQDKRSIYAAHGSFIILTRQFFNCNGMIDYPIFLFGEELYIAETARINGLTIQYRTDLIVHDDESVSTSKVASSLLRKNHVKALKYIIEKFF